MKPLHYIFHGLTYNIAWLLGIVLAARGFAWASTAVVLLIVGLQYYWQYCIAHQYAGLTKLVILLTVIGSGVDTALLHAGLVIFAANPFTPYLCPPWLMAIWVSFAVLLYATLSGLFKQLLALALFSFFGFSVAYAIGVKIGAAFFPEGYATALLIGVVWMVLLPILIYFYNRRTGISC